MARLCSLLSMESRCALFTSDSSLTSVKWNLSWHFAFLHCCFSCYGAVGQLVFNWNDSLNASCLNLKTLPSCSQTVSCLWIPLLINWLHHLWQLLQGSVSFLSRQAAFQEYPDGEHSASFRAKNKQTRSDQRAPS